VRDYGTILHPTNFSEQSLCALGVARDLARSAGSDLLLIHVAPAELARKRGYRREAFAALRRLAALDDTVRTQVLLLRGDPATQILCTEGQIECGLIVMGEGSRSGWRRLLCGDVAAAVKRDARCPVLTVRLPAGEAPDCAARAESVAHLASREYR